MITAQKIMNNDNKKYRLLIVEDERDLLEVLTDKFERNGFEVFGGKNGEEGLALSLKHHPDLIILDLVMPKKSGAVMLEELRKDSWGKDAKVIVLTNLSGTTSSMANLLDKGVYEYLVKSSWSIDDIVKRVEEKLNPHIA